MIRFYGLTIQEVLEMPRNYFWGLYEQIPYVKASEELDLLSITRSAYHAKNVKDLASRLQHQAQGHIVTKLNSRPNAGGLG